MQSKNRYKRIQRGLANHDYSAEGLYFITPNIKNRVTLFGDIYDGELQLNVFW